MTTKLSLFQVYSISHSTYVYKAKQDKKTLQYISVTSVPLHGYQVFFLCWELSDSAPFKTSCRYVIQPCICSCRGPDGQYFWHYLCSVQKRPQATCSMKGCGCVEIKFYLYKEAGGPPGLAASHLRPCGVSTKAALELVPSVAASLSSQKYFKISFSSLAPIAWLDTRLSKSPLQCG